MSATKMQTDFEPRRRIKLKKSAGVSSVIHRAFLKLDDEVAGQKLLQMVADICTP